MLTLLGSHCDTIACVDEIGRFLLLGEPDLSMIASRSGAVTAEPGDDVSSLELPAEDSGASQGRKDAKGAQQGAEEANVKETQEKAPERQQESQSDVKQGGTVQKQKYPLYPSVETLLHQNGLSSADAEKIPATGPQGRIL